MQTGSAKSYKAEVLDSSIDPFAGRFEARNIPDFLDCKCELATENQLKRKSWTPPWTHFQRILMLQPFLFPVLNEAAESANPEPKRPSRGEEGLSTMESTAGEIAH